MASKINVGDLHAKLLAAGVPIDGVALDRPGKSGISVDYQNDATPEQKAQAEQIIKEYDQDEEDASKTPELSIDAILAAKSVSDLKTILIQLYNLKG